MLELPDWKATEGNLGYVGNAVQTGKLGPVDQLDRKETRVKKVDVAKRDNLVPKERRYWKTILLQIFTLYSSTCYTFFGVLLDLC